MKKAKMTVKSASRIYSATAKQNNGMIPKKSFAARAMKAATKSTKGKSN